MLRTLDLPITLGQLGIENNIDEKVGIIANTVVGNLESYHALDYKLTSEKIKEAIFKADEIGNKYFGQRVIA